MPTEETRAAGRSAAAFARRHIAPAPHLHLENRFPIEIWQAMGAEGLLGLMISKNYGGMGGTSVDLAAVLHNLTKEGHNFGLALSFLIHQIVARYVIEAWADETQKARYLPRLATGAITACLAVSEPQKGAHPKHLTSTAFPGPGGYRLTGEKTYITNGPIADLFVVIAVSRTTAKRKYFSALLVPRNLSDLEVLPPLEIPFFKPAPHGGIRFKDLNVPPDALLGPQDYAYDNIVLPVRRIEDVLMTAAVTGLLEKQADLLAAALTPQPDSAVSEEIQLTFGKLKSMLDAGKVISRKAAKLLDTSLTHPELISLPLFFKSLTADVQELITKLQPHAGRNSDTGLLNALTRELRTSIKLGRSAAKLQQQKVGATIFP